MVERAAVHLGNARHRVPPCRCRIVRRVSPLAKRLDTPRAAEENTARTLEDGMERVAECHCGQLKAIASGEPERVYVCHCKSCQRRTGAVVHSGSRWLKSQVRIEGEEKIYGRMADSGFEIRFHFCPDCGSSVFWEGDRGPDHYGIAVGCFADPTFPPPVYSSYEEAMHPWLGVATAKEHYPGARPANLPVGG
jgi:hypothetical protein